MTSLTMNRNAWVIFALVALGTVSTGDAYQSSLPRVSSVSTLSISTRAPPLTTPTTTSRVPTLLSAKRQSLWKPPSFGLLSNKAVTATSSSLAPPRLTPLQQSTATGEMASSSPTLRRPSLRAPLARLNEIKQNILVKKSQKVPTYSKLIKFCATTVLIWLSEPLLSLVDTTVVGWTQGAKSVVQLASLGPATTLMDTLLYMTYFLALSTTNLLTQGLAQKDWRGLQRWTSYLLTVAVIVGGSVSALMFSPAGPAMLQGLAGSAASPELLAYAVKYTRIRAAVAPFSVLGMVSQSFCLANLQSKGPLLAVAVASAVNIAGDLALRKHGVVGAAAATAVAGLSATAILLHSVRKQFLQWRQNEVQEWEAEQETQAIRQDLVAETNLDISQIQSLTTTPNLPNGTDAFVMEEENENETSSDKALVMATMEIVPALEEIESTSMRCDNQENVDSAMDGTEALVVKAEPPKAISFFSMPSRSSVIKLATISGPLCVNMWAKMASYAALTVKVTSFGVVPLAAHNVLMRLFFFLGCFADAMGLSAQAFLPPTLYPLDKVSFQAVLDRLRGMTAVTALMIGQAALFLVHKAGPYLARDGAMRAAMIGQATLLGWALFLHPLVVMAEGTAIATRDFGNLVKSYATALAVHCVVLSTAGSFGAVWKALVLFQSLRFVNLNLFRRRNPLKDPEMPAMEAVAAVA